MINTLQPETHLHNGKYRILRFIKSGGFGCTYEAENTYFEERVAIKEFFVRDFCNRSTDTRQITVGTDSKKDLVERLKQKFLDEAKALYKLKHPGIVHVSDVFEENGTAYYVMDYIDGCSLDVYVKKNGPLSEGLVLNYVRQICDALKYVHSQNRLHLDLKPGNMMLVEDRSKVILIDFGTAKQYDECSGENTSTLLGSTPGYAPLEQTTTKITQFFPATDIYALGATMYKLLTGVTPLTASERGSGEELEPLPSTVSTATRNAIEQAMQLPKMKRPQSVDEFMALLDASVEHAAETSATVSSGDEDDDATVILGSEPKPQPAPAPVSDQPTPSPKKKTRRWLLWWVIALVVLTVIGLFVLTEQKVVPTEQEVVEEAPGEGAKEAEQEETKPEAEPSPQPKRPSVPGEGSQRAEQPGNIYREEGEEVEHGHMDKGTKVFVKERLSSANCHIVSKQGEYYFKPVKGESNESVGNISSVCVLWESFGTSATPRVGDLIKSVDYKDGMVVFETADTFKEGNAVIAAKDASGEILWSWHIWLTDQPQGQVYYNNAGTMMDRNLGATSTTPGDVGALGLLYQWGRKDPFLGSASISSITIAKSTITWPDEVSSNSRTGTIAYATANPTTFITYNDSDSDWYYTGSSSTDNTRWTTSESSKSIYDPCPAGWRVPDGGYNGVWSKALGSGSYFDYTYNSTNEGMNFSDKFGSASTIWYPASGCRLGNDGSLSNVGYDGLYWSASPYNFYANYLCFFYNGVVYPSKYYYRAYGFSVRCLQE